MTLGKPRKTGTRWAVTVSAGTPGTATLKATDGSLATSDLIVTVGPFLDHPKMDTDLIADVLRTNDTARKVALMRILGNDVDNVTINEIRRAPSISGATACGTMSKTAGQKLFCGSARTMATRTLQDDCELTLVGTPPRQKKVWACIAAEEVLYDPKRLEEARKRSSPASRQAGPSHRHHLHPRRARSNMGATSRKPARAVTRC